MPTRKLAWVVLLLVMFAGARGAYAQPTRQITGNVVDAAGGAGIVGATIQIKDTPGAPITTVADGAFDLAKAPATDVVLTVSAPDYAPVEVKVKAGKTTSIAIYMSKKVAAPPATRTITGVVRDQTSNAPLASATVKVQSSGATVTTDGDGLFVLENLPTGDVVLDVSAADHSPVTLTISPTATTAHVGLPPTSAAPSQPPPTNPTTRSIHGKVTDAGGEPGGGAQLRLRGISTINGQSSPLYVIDGVIVSNVAIPSGQNTITAAAAGGSSSNQDNPVNRISDLNPNDIDNVEVLKGAAAAALYGSKAANGVVIITTKHGKAGKSTVTATQRVGFSQVSNTLGSRKFNDVGEVMDAFKNNPDAVAAFNEGKTYDHEAELTQIKAARETVVSATGGTEHGGYFGSVLIRDEPGVLIGTDYSKESGRLGATWEFAKRVRLAVTANIIHSSSDRGLTNNDNTGTSTYVVLSSTPSFFNLQPGSNGLYPVNPFVGSGANPIQTQHLLVNNEDVWRVIGATNASVKAYEDKQQSLSFQLGFGFDRFHQQNTLFSPPELNYESADGLLGTSISGSTYNLNANVGGSGVYTYEPENHAFKSATSVGFTYEYVDLNSVTVAAQNLTAGQQNVGSGTSIAVSEARLRTKDTGLYLQEEIQALDKRLSVLGGLLAERSSLNGDTGQYYLFPKLAATYEIPQKVFQTLRVRGALGEAGNRPNFGQKFTPLNATTNIGGNAGITITGPTGAIAGDPNIKPERQLEVEGGVDAVFKDERVVAELTAYQRSITDLLLQRTLAPSTGFASEFFNGGSMRNRGVEAALQVVPIANPFEWTSRAIFTLNRSEITDLPVPTFDISTVGFGTGLGAFRIEKGKSATQIVGTIDGNGTVAVVGNGEPDFRVGWANNFKYKNYGLATLIDWQQGSSVINLTRLLYDFGQVSPDYVDKGTKRLDAFSNGDIRPYVEDATFVKLREVSLYWQVPDAYVKPLMLDAARVSLSGRNLLTFTNYSGLDPEVSNFGNQPIGRNYDVAPYPPSRQYWLSVDASF